MSKYIEFSENGNTLKFAKATCDVCDGIYVHGDYSDGHSDDYFYFESEIPEQKDLSWWLHEVAHIDGSDPTIRTVKLKDDGEAPEYINILEMVSVGDITIWGTREKLLELGRLLHDNDVSGEWKDISYDILYRFDEDWNDSAEFFDLDDARIN